MGQGHKIEKGINFCKKKQDKNILNKQTHKRHTTIAHAAGGLINELLSSYFKLS